MKAKLISFFLIVAFFIPTFSVSTTAQELQDDPSVSKSPENQYFCIEKTVYGENLIETFESDTAKAYFRQIQTDHSYSTVTATSKQVYVKETIEKNGNTIDSHLMSDHEVLQYEMQTAVLRSLNTSVGTLAKTWVGDDSNEPTVKKLTLYLVVYKDSSRNYYAYGTADWTSNSGSGENTPSAGDDFIAITWGGNGELKCDTATVSGKYQNDNAISFDKTKSDTYQGYCWSFPEQKKFLGIIETTYANYIDTYVKLKKTYSSNKGKETNIKMTYIHTYQSTVGSVSFEASSEQGMAASLSLSTCSKQWPLEVDVPNISY